MIKTELQFRKVNEELFLQYLKGLQINASKDQIAARRTWEHAESVSKIDPFNYIRYARKDEKARTINMIIDAYERIINGGIIDENDPLFH